MCSAATDKIWSSLVGYQRENGGDSNRVVEVPQAGSGQQQLRPMRKMCAVLPVELH